VFLWILTRSSRSRREGSAGNGKHLKRLEAESDLTNQGHTIADRTAGKNSGDVAGVSGGGAGRPCWVLISNVYVCIDGTP
jgi:hypothetical protein